MIRNEKTNYPWIFSSLSRAAFFSPFICFGHQRRMKNRSSSGSFLSVLFVLMLHGRREINDQIIIFIR
jgi:hypothetical protein